STQFDIGKNHIIDALSVLCRAKLQVASYTELDPVHVMCAKEVLLLLLVLPRFGNIHREPAAFAGVKLRPAMVAGNLARILAFRQRQSPFKARGNLLRTRHRDKNGMEVRAVAVLGVTGPERVPRSPASASLVISHGGEGVIIEGAAFIQV